MSVLEIRSLSVEVAGLPVEAEAPWVAQAIGPNLALRALLPHEWIVVGHAVFAVNAGHVEAQ